MAQAQRVVEAISTILPKSDPRFPPQLRYLREHEATDLASVCEEWLRGVAAEEWSEAMLAALPEVTAACLNALLLAMLHNASAPGSSSAAPPSAAAAPVGGGGDYGSGYGGPGAPDLTTPRMPVESPRPGTASGGGGDGQAFPGGPAPPGALEMAGVLRRHFGNRASELLGVMGAASARDAARITESKKKKKAMSSADLQVGLAGVGLDLPLATVQGTRQREREKERRGEGVGRGRASERVWYLFKYHAGSLRCDINPLKLSSCVFVGMV